MRAVVTDIEGTTTSLSLVKDVLFPYARRHVAAFVHARREDEAIARILADVAALEGVAGFDESGAVDVLTRWMDEDRKATPLKTLQGLIWADGYRSGELRGHVYEDAAARLREWHAAGIRLYVYSSGSIAAQQLLFAHTDFGDLTSLFSGYFDTTIGPKLDARSYVAIARAIAVAPADVLFLSDAVGELDAARAAGFRTTWVIRGTPPAKPEGGHARASTFADVA